MDISELPEKQVYEIAAPMWKIIIKGSNEIDFELFSSSFSEELKDRIGKDKFEKQCNEFPLLTSLGSFEPVACFRRENGVTIVFRQFSTRLKGEFIGQLRLIQSEGRTEITELQVY